MGTVTLMGTVLVGTAHQALKPLQPGLAPVQIGTVWRKNKVRKLSLFAVLCLTVILSGCTITYYELRNEIAPKASSDKKGSCDFNYSFTMDDYRRFRTIGNQPNPRAAEDLEKYMKATQTVFTQKGCKANKIDDQDKTEFKIDVLRTPQLSALPQEWLTGLTCGAIPSWGTRYGEYRYTFTNLQLNKNNTYYVDRPAFNHIILFPVFWISFWGTDEIELYKRALANFLENS